MQTWAKRGVHAALVTGGMLAVGSGVASTSGTCPEAPAPSAGGAALPPAFDHGDDGTPRHSGQSFAGELFPGESGDPSFDDGEYETGRHALRTDDPVTSFAGIIDPVRDVLPIIENETTREIPAIVDDATVPMPIVRPGERTVPRLELAGWVAEPSTAIEHPAVEQPRGKHAQRLPGTPADGFQRSLSWMGTIGGVAHDFAAAEPLSAASGTAEAPPDQVGDAAADPRSEDAHALGFPTEDPAAEGGFLEADGLVEFWDGVLGQVPPTEHDAGGGLLDVETDLTSAELAGPVHSMHRVPPALLAESLTTVPRALAAKQDALPLRVPGEALAKASEIPPLNDLVLRGDVLGERSRAESPDVRTGLPLGGHPHAAGDESASEPSVSHIIEALGGKLGQPQASEEATQPIPKIPAFTGTPLRSLVEVIFLDDLTAAVPELRQATSDPFRVAASPPVEIPQDMALPLLDEGLLDISALQGEMLSTPLHELFTDLEDTVVLERI